MINNEVSKLYRTMEKCNILIKNKESNQEVCLFEKGSGGALLKSAWKKIADKDDIENVAKFFATKLRLPVGTMSDLRMLILFTMHWHKFGDTYCVFI